MLIVVKAVLSGILVALASELAKRWSLWGAVMVSIPFTSLLTAIWLHVETGNVEKNATFLRTVFWAHIPTLVFFILCPILLRAGMNFWLSVILSLLVTAITFYVYAMGVRQFGIRVYE